MAKSLIFWHKFTYVINLEGFGISKRWTIDHHVGKQSTHASRVSNNNASGMITHLPNLHNISGASNSSKARAASNHSGTRHQADRSIHHSNMPQANSVITMSKKMVSTKINGLSNLNVIKKKSIKTRKGNTRHQSKTSFTGEGSVSKRVFRSTHSQMTNFSKNTE